MLGWLRLRCVPFLAVATAGALLFGCGSDEAPHRRSVARAPDELPGCDRDRVRAAVAELGARQSKVGRFRGHVTVAPLRVTLETCAEGAPLSQCEARFRPRANERVHVWAITERRERVRPVSDEQLAGQLGELTGAHPDIEFGERVRTEVLADPRVCVRVFRTRHVRLEEATGEGVPLLDLVEARLDGEAGVFEGIVFEDIDGPRFRARCPAFDELVRLPAVAADGPCAALVAADAARR